MKRERFYNIRRYLCLLIATVVGLLQGSSYIEAHAERARITIKSLGYADKVPICANGIVYYEGNFKAEGAPFGLSGNYAGYCCEALAGNPAGASSTYDRPVKASSLGVDASLLRKLYFYAPWGPGWDYPDTYGGVSLARSFGLSKEQAICVSNELGSYIYHGKNWYHTVVEHMPDPYRANTKKRLQEIFNGIVANFPDPIQWGYDAYVMKNSNVDSKTTNWIGQYAYRQSIAFIYGSPQVAKTSDSATRTVTIPVSEQINMPTKVSSKDNTPLAGAKANVYMTEDGVTTKLGTATSNAKGLFVPDGKWNVSKTFSAGPIEQQYVKFANHSWESDVAPGNLPQSEQAAKDQIKATLKTNLDNQEKTWRNKSRTITFKEITPPNNYLNAGKTYTGTCTFNGAKATIGNITNTPKWASVKETVTKEVTYRVNTDAYKIDGVTKYPLSGGKFDVYIQVGNDWKKLTSTPLTAENGKVTASNLEYKETRTYTPINERLYALDWAHLTEAQKKDFKAKGIFETKEQAQEASRKDADTLWKADQEALNKGRPIKIVETEAPAGYAIDGEGVAQGTLDSGGTYSPTMINTGVGIIAVLKTDSDRAPLANAKFEVRDAQGTLVDSWTSDTNVHYVTKLRPNTEYTVTETGVPEGYVEPITRTWKMTSSNGTEKPEDLKVNEIVNWSSEAKKLDVTAKGVAGAVLTVTDKNGNKKDEWTTDGTSHKILNMQEGETYTMTETKTPTGYVTANPVTFTVASKRQEVPMIDTRVLVSKVDDKGKAVSGATLQVIDKDKKVMDTWTTDGTKHAVSGLRQGQTYTLQETGTPTGYIKAKDITFTANKETTDIELTMKDYRIKVSKQTVGGTELAGAKMQVKDKTGKVVDEWTSTTTPHYIENLVEGEEYILHEDLAPVGMNRAQDIPFTAISGDQHLKMVDTVTSVIKTDTYGNPVAGAELEVIDEEGNVVDSWVSEETPHNVENMTAGQQYTLREKKAPNGYVYATDIELSISAGDDVTITMLDSTVEVGKVDEDGEYVEGATLQVVDKDGEVKDEWVSGERLLHLNQDLTDGLVLADENGREYTVQELQPDGYVEPTPAPVAEDETAGTDTEPAETTEPTLESKRFRVTYKNDDGVLSHAIVDYQGYEKGHLVSNLTADAEYTLKEVETPKGYVKANDMKFSTKSEENVTVTMVDKQVKFTKEDITGEEIEGAEITVVDKKGKEVDKWISTDEPHYIENLEDGKSYTLKETITPGGYVQASEVDFTVDKDTVKAHYTMVDTIHRVDKRDDNGNVVKGARLAVFDTAGKKIDEWTTGQHVLNIPNGVLEEVAENGTATIQPSKAIPVLTKADKDEMYVNIDKALVLAYPTLPSYFYKVEDLKKPPVEEIPPEESVPDEPKATVDGSESAQTTEAIETVSDIELTSDSYLAMTFEGMRLTADELDTKILEAKTLLEKDDRTSAENKAKAKEDLYAYIEQQIEEYNAKAEESMKDMSAIYLTGAQGMYQVEFVDSKGIHKFVDIDEYGDETTHRVSGMTEGETYILKEMKSPAGYALAPEIQFIADSSMDLHMTVLDRLLLERKTGVGTTNYMPWVSLATIVLLVCMAFLPDRKKKKVQN